MKKYIFIISGLIILYLLLSKRSKLPAIFTSISNGFRSVWEPLTGKGF